ncbi:MAG: hypothetical protein KAJ44_04835 [Thermoplasmatales archaeon]|nr:hypothetical protein [Thermoplasmatales archaeon]
MSPRAIYLPVVNYDSKEEFKYWTNNCPIFYNNLLVSPFTTGWDKNRRHFDGKTLKIYADSGGYQVVTMDKRVASLDVLRWQQRIAHIAFTLDIPPHHFSKNYNKDQFLKCMYQSNKNADLMWEFNKDYDMQLWGVIQGKTYDELKMWYEDLTKGHEYDGYCIALSIHKSDADLPWIEQLRFVSTIPKCFHFLGWSEPLFVVVLAKLAQKMNLRYTYDSSTPTIGARYGQYIEPSSLSPVPFNKYKSKLPCMCPTCSRHSVEEMMDTTQLLNLHNLYMKISFCRLANLAASDDDLFKYLLDEIIVMRPNYKKSRDVVESCVMRLLYGEDCQESATSSYGEGEAIEQLQIKTTESEGLTDFDKEYLQQFIMKFMNKKCNNWYILQSVRRFHDQ